MPVPRSGRGERVDLPALYDPRGRYGRWNAAAIITYAVGILVQVPFLAQSMYYLWASRRNVAPAEIIRMPVAETRTPVAP